MWLRTWLIVSLLTLLALIEIVLYAFLLGFALATDAHARNGWWVEEHAKVLNSYEHYGYRASMRTIKGFWDNARGNEGGYLQSYKPDLLALIVNYAPKDAREEAYKDLLVSDLIDSGVELYDKLDIYRYGNRYSYYNYTSVIYQKQPKLLKTKENNLTIAGLRFKSGTIKLGYDERRYVSTVYYGSTPYTSYVDRAAIPKTGTESLYSTTYVHDLKLTKYQIGSYTYRNGVYTYDFRTRLSTN